MTTTLPAGWKPIESAPKDGTEVLAWRHDCGQFIASYTSADAFPMTQDELDAMDEETLFAKDWFTQWPDATRLDGSEAPTLWQPLPVDPCQTCNDQGAVGNILNAEPCPDCTPPTSAQDDAKDEQAAFEAWGMAGCEMVDDPQSGRFDIARHCAWEAWKARASVAAPAAGDALPTIKGAAITGGYVVVTPAGWGEDKPQKVRDAILRLFPVNPAYTPKPEAAQQGKGGEA